MPMAKTRLEVRKQPDCYHCGKRLTHAEAVSFIALYPFKHCDKCAKELGTLRVVSDQEDTTDISKP